MRYVLDCSVAIKWFFPETLSEEAHRFLEAFQAGRVAFIAPEVVVAEFGHTVRKLAATQELAASDSLDIFNDFMALSIPTAPISPLAPQAMRLALDRMGTFYDALYLSLAVREGCCVLSADDRMATAFRSLDRVARLGETAVP